LKAYQVPTIVSRQCLWNECRGGSSLSPKKVPAATIAKPGQSPYTTPHSKAMSSCPKSGGKEIAIKIATGTRKPAGTSLIFIDTGFILSTILSSGNRCCQ